MPIQEINMNLPPWSEFTTYWKKWTVHTECGLSYVAEKVVQKLENNGKNDIVSVPPEALVTVAGYTAIKSTWLNANFPLDAWKKAGWIDPIAFEKFGWEDLSQPLVWVREENWTKQYFCNPKWAAFLAKIYGGYLEYIKEKWDKWTSPTKAQYDALKAEWKNSEQIIETLWLVKGWRSSFDGRLISQHYAIMRSRLLRPDGFFRIWWMIGSESRIIKFKYWVGYDSPPRVFLDKNSE